jgi:hypothetical protein
MITRISTYSQIKGTTLKQPCLVATTQNETLSGLSTIDGIALSDYDRVLVWKQDTGQDNGIYVVTGGTWYRATDMSTSEDFFTGVEVYVNSGNTYAQKTFILGTDNPISAGTTPINFELTSNVNYVENYGVGRVLISDGSVEGIVAQSGLTYDFDTQTLGVSGKVQFDTGTTVTSSVAGLYWDDGNGTLSLGLKGGNVNLQIGEENVSLCYNDDVVPLTDGMVVYVSGSQGNRPKIKRAIASSDQYSVTVLGIVTETIPVGEEGFVTTFGMVNNLNTLGFTGGTALWLSPTVLGGLTEVKPIAPQHTVLVGYVVRVSNTVGSIFVHTSNGWELEELHNVRISGVTDGDLLVYDSELGVWVNSKTVPGDLVVSGDVITYGNQYIESASGSSLTSGTNIVETISCVSGSSAHFDYFVRGTSNQIRSGVILAAWNCTGATYTETSTPDLNGSTEGISFSVDVSSNIVRLNAVVTSGTWDVKVGSRIIF